MKIEARCHDTLLMHHALYPKTSHDLQAVASHMLPIRPWKSEFDLPFAKIEEVDDDKELTKAYKKALKVIERESGKQYKTAKAVENAVKRWNEARELVASIGPEMERRRTEEIAKRYQWLQHYNAIDTIATDAVDARLSKQLEQENVAAVYENDREMMIYATDWYRVGVGIDQEVRSQLSAEYTTEIERLRQSLCDTAGTSDFNPASPKQLADVLVNKVGIVPNKLTAGGDMSTSEDALFEYQDHPFVQTLMEFRKLSKLESTYIRGMGSKVGRDGRLHPSWKKHVTPSGRFATSPNIQNWPYSMKRMLVAQPGRKIIACDYSALELRIAMLLAGEEELIKVVQAGGDVHVLFAETYYEEIWRNSTPDRQKSLRKESKPVTFGDIYRAGADTLWRQVRKDVPHITAEQVEVMQARKRAKYNNFNVWAEVVTRRANEDLELRTPWLGRIRRWPLGSVPDTEATNHPVQGGAGDICDGGAKRWHRRLMAEGLYHTRVWPNIQIHDDLRAEVVDGYEHEAGAMLAECMRTEITWRSEITGRSYTMPFDVEVSIGENHAPYQPDPDKPNYNPNGLREIKL